MERTRPRTYTLRHDTGVTVTVDSIDVAAALTGWPGWTAYETNGAEPVGIDLKAAPRKGDLLDYASALGISGVSANHTRAEMESTIAAWHEEITP